LRTIIAVAAVAGLTSATAMAADEDRGSTFELGGLAFSDLYYIPSHHTEEGEGARGFVLRRGYLTLDADFSEKLFGRARLEVNQAGEFETYTFEVDFKDLHVGWNLGRQKLLVGLSPTPTFDLIESIWGLRYLVRTPMDLQGVASRDTGVSAKGPLNPTGTLSYRVMAGAGLEFGNETGDGRKWMGALAWNPAPGWTFDFYIDTEELSGPFDRTTLQLFVGYQTEGWRWGAQYSHQDRQDDPPLELASAFVIGRLGKLTSLIGRVDRLIQPSPRADNIAYIPFAPGAPATFFIGGVEFKLGPHLRLTPNTIVITYDKNSEGIRPKTDWHLRLTFFLNFE